MPEGWHQEIGQLLDQSRIAFLSTLGEHSPEASMAPYAIHQGDVLLHLSKLARHTGNLERDPRAGLMICTPEAEADSPLALPRLSLTGQASRIPDDALPEAKSAYLKRLPEADPLFGFADFSLFRFSVREVQWVGGFGKARSIPLSAWATLLNKDDVTEGGAAG